MINVSFSSSFKRAFKKRIKGQQPKEDLFMQKLEVFVNDPFHPQLRTHKLSGTLKDLWSFSIEYDLRVIFHFTDANNVVFENIGSHNEVY